MWNKILIRKLTSHNPLLRCSAPMPPQSLFQFRWFCSKYQGKLKEMMKDSKGKGSSKFTEDTKQKEDHLTMSAKKFAKQDLKKLLTEQKLDPTQEGFEAKDSSDVGSFTKIKRFFSNMREATNDKIQSPK